MFSGGLIGALLVVNGRMSLPLLLAAVLLAAAYAITKRLTRSSAPWTLPL
jgi:drug/metabolite transporter (DMT)-like permease